MKLEKPSVNYRNDLDEYLTHFKLRFESIHFLNITFSIA
jgi:hypothetical protein